MTRFLRDEPPLRLLLGSDALGYMTAKMAAQKAEMEAWISVTKGTDFPAA